MMFRLLLILGVLVLSGCKSEPTKKVEDPVIMSKTKIGPGYGDLKTVIHDGYKFVVFTDILNHGGAGGLVIHPEELKKLEHKCEH